MSSYEDDEINSLPEKYRPLGAWAYFGYSILFSIPIVGFIFLIVFSISGSNINRCNYARSFFCIIIVAIIVVIIMAFAGGEFIPQIMQQFKQYIAG